MKLNKSKIPKETDYEIHDNFLFFSFNFIKIIHDTQWCLSEKNCQAIAPLGFWLSV